MPALRPLYYRKDAADTTRVMSVQSDSVSSNVGIKAAHPIYTFMKIELTGIPLALYSTHTGYDSYYGVVQPEGVIANNYDAFCANGLGHFHYVVTGYLFSGSLLKETAEVVRRMRRRDPDLIFLCDPVLGDKDRFYVDEGLVDLYLESLLPMADIVTPNLFELEKLGKTRISNLETAFEAMAAMNGPRVVILTSIPSPASARLCSLLSFRSGGETFRYVIEYPETEVHFCGCGDAFSALFVSWLDRLEGDIIGSFEKTVNSMQQILRSTYLYAEKFGFSLQNLNLRIVESPNSVTSPLPSFEAREFIISH